LKLDLGCEENMIIKKVEPKTRRKKILSSLCSCSITNKTIYIGIEAYNLGENQKNS
jgi:hypothetical protein